MHWDLIIIGVVYLIAAIFVTFYGKNRKIGAIRAFIYSIIFTPLIGGIIVGSSEKVIIYHVKQYKCPECGYSFTERHPKCIICAKEGKTVKLEERIRVMT